MSGIVAHGNLLQRSRRPKTAESALKASLSKHGLVLLQRSRRPKTAERSMAVLTPADNSALQRSRRPKTAERYVHA